VSIRTGRLPASHGPRTAVPDTSELTRAGSGQARLRSQAAASAVEPVGFSSAAAKRSINPEAMRRISTSRLGELAEGLLQPGRRDLSCQPKERLSAGFAEGQHGLAPIVIAGLAGDQTGEL